MLIIVEGPDCSGKTTLAKFIARVTTSSYVHMSGHPALHAAMPEYHSAVLDSIAWSMKNAAQGYVLDRSWPSEHVYGREFRPSLVDRFPFKEFQDRIRGLGGKYIFCMDDHVEDRHAVYHQHAAIDHMPYDRGQFHGVVVAYQALIAGMMTRPDCMTYDMTKEGADLQAVLNKVYLL